jgi:two-component system nitrogen regulation response regulator GlnG
MVERYLAGHFASYGRDLPPAGLYDRILQHVERPLLMAALAATRGNQIRAAALLGLNRNTLRKKIRDLDIQVFRSPALEVPRRSPLPPAGSLSPLAGRGLG